MSRVVENNQRILGQIDIADITFNDKSRDDIPQILRGLQYLYTTPEIKEQIFSLLEENIAPEVSKNNGRPGMALWDILVIGTLRLDLNCDYDRLHELVNHHNTIRAMLGKSGYASDYEYQLQSIKDNVSLLTPELLDSINTVIVNAGHALLKKSGGPLHGRCDSFAVETDVHYPTDITLLFDAIRKTIQLSVKLCNNHNLSDFRQSKHNIRMIKKQMRKTQKIKRSNSKNDKKKVEREAAIKSSHRTLINMSHMHLATANNVIESFKDCNLSLSDMALIKEIGNYSDHALRQIDQITRRVIKEEIIPHEEKVFSIFEPHTEWIVKGKVGVPVELGMRACILEDQYQFILHYRVMEKETDDKIAVQMVIDTKEKFPRLGSCSFDKGFHSKENQEELKPHLDVVALRRKGKLSKASKEIESSKEFRKAAYKHSAVESAINGLERHGLDICPDHGINGFKRYVGLAIVSRNIHRIGSILHQKVQARLKRARHNTMQKTLKIAA